MSDDAQGPKSLLYRSIEENRRIKVWTRSHSYVRSICTGYLLAFDQYWNLAMIDVDEIYRIPFGKKQQQQQPQQQQQQQEGNITKEMANVSITDDNNNNDADGEFNLYKCGRSFQLAERHSNQLFIRGDNVVTITLAD